MASALTGLTLTSVEEIQVLIPRWRELAVASGNIFVTPEWATAWLGVYGSDGYEPSIRCVTFDGDLVGVLPLMRTRDGELRFVGDGAGDYFAPVTADHPEISERVLATLFETLRGDGSLIALSNVERSAGWLDHLQQELRLSAVADRQQVLPYLDLDGSTWESFLASKSANFRSQLGRKQRALERLHTTTFRLATAGTLDDDLTTFFGLHDDRWAERGGSSSSSPRMRLFLRKLCGDLAVQGWLRLWTLELDGSPAASWLGWKVGPRYSYYLAGFDPSFAERSPGLVLLAHTVREACGEGAATYDFLLGDEDYKSRFASGATEIETVLLGTRWQRRLLLGRLDHKARQAARLMPTPLRRRVRDAAGVLERRLPLARHR